MWDPSQLERIVTEPLWSKLADCWWWRRRGAARRADCCRAPGANSSRWPRCQLCRKELRLRRCRPGWSEPCPRPARSWLSKPYDVAAGARAAAEGPAASASSRVAAGIPAKAIEDAIRRSAGAMPNTPALVGGAGVTAIASGLAAGADDLYGGPDPSGVGAVVRVKEIALDAVTGLSGSGRRLPRAPPEPTRPRAARASPAPAPPSGRDARLRDALRRVESSCASPTPARPTSPDRGYVARRNRPLLAGASSNATAFARRSCRLMAATERSRELGA